MVSGKVKSKCKTSLSRNAFANVDWKISAIYYPDLNVQVITILTHKVCIYPDWITSLPAFLRVVPVSKQTDTGVLTLLWYLARSLGHFIWNNDWFTKTYSKPIKARWIFEKQTMSWFVVIVMRCFNTLRLRQNGCHFSSDTSKRIFLNENARISNKISPKFVPKGPINNIPALVQIKGWYRPGDKPLSEPMMVISSTHTCIIRPQWVNVIW